MLCQPQDSVFFVLDAHKLEGSRYPGGLLRGMVFCIVLGGVVPGGRAGLLEVFGRPEEVTYQAYWVAYCAELLNNRAHLVGVVRRVIEGVEVVHPAPPQYAASQNATTSLLSQSEWRVI